MELLTKLWFIVILALFFFAFVRLGLFKHLGFRITFIVAHALLLTYCTLFIFNQPSWNWGEQATLTKELSKDQAVDTNAYTFIHNNFILVDNAEDKQLIPDPEGDEDDSTKIVITNKNTLSRFISLLDSNSDKIDLLVYDVELNLADEDSLLKQGLQELCNNNKLLLSVDKDNRDDNHLEFQFNCFGNISEQGSEGLFVSHTIKKGDYYSMPYKLYAHLNNVASADFYFRDNLLRERYSGNTEQSVNNTFFPQFHLTDEKLLRGEAEQKTNTLSLDIADVPESADQMYYQLSEPMADSGKSFIDNLNYRKSKGQKNIIFLGSFISPTDDVHSTIYGNLHGPTILLNIFYTLQTKEHYLSVSLILLLFLGYIVITGVLIYRTQKIKITCLDNFTKNEVEHQSKRKNLFPLIKKTKNKALVELLISFFMFILEFLFVEELHQVLLLGLIWLLAKTTGQMMNIFSLLIYLGVVNALLRFAKERFEKEEPKTHQPTT